MREREREMTLSMLGIGLFKTEGLDEYGTAAVGWLRGAGLKATESAGGTHGRGWGEEPGEWGGGLKYPHRQSHCPLHKHTHICTHTHF